MLFWSIKIMLLSLVLILLVHHLYIYFKNTLTIPKTKDLVNKPKETYNEIYDIIKKNPENTNVNANNKDKKEISISENKFVSDNKNMKEELQMFVNELENRKKQPKQKNSTLKNTKSVNFNNDFNSSPLLSANDETSGMGSYAAF